MKDGDEDIEEEGEAVEEVSEPDEYDYIPELKDEHRRLWTLDYAMNNAVPVEKILAFAEACETFLKTGETTGLRVVKGGK